jgi:hypothetical protein
LRLFEGGYSGIFSSSKLKAWCADTAREGITIKGSSGARTNQGSVVWTDLFSFRSSSPSLGWDSAFGGGLTTRFDGPGGGGENRGAWWILSEPELNIEEIMWPLCWTASNGLTARYLQLFGVYGVWVDDRWEDEDHGAIARTGLEALGWCGTEQTALQKRVSSYWGGFPFRRFGKETTLCRRASRARMSTPRVSRGSMMSSTKSYR